jgi:hypothetical protein
VIIEWLIQLGTAFGEWVLGQTPDTSSAANLVFQADNAMRPVFSAAAGLGAWIPWFHIGATIAVVLGFYLLMFALKVLRQLVTHIPLFGGTG